MTRRLFPDNDAWPSEASRAANNVTVALMDLLAILEEDGPVDLRDFHFLVTHAAGTFVAGLSVTRRLGDPDSPPNPIVRAYPRLNRQGGCMTDDSGWDCEESPSGSCQYDNSKDPAWDNCIHCNEPYERK